MYGNSWDEVGFVKNCRFDTIINITQEPQALHRFKCACVFIDKSTMIKYHQLLSNVLRLYGKSRFAQLATASSSTPPQRRNVLLCLVVQLYLTLQNDNPRFFFVAFVFCSGNHICAMKLKINNIYGNLSYRPKHLWNEIKRADDKNWHVWFGFHNGIKFIIRKGEFKAFTWNGMLLSNKLFTVAAGYQSRSEGAKPHRFFQSMLFFKILLIYKKF